MKYVIFFLALTLTACDLFDEYDPARKWDIYEDMSKDMPEDTTPDIAQDVSVDTPQDADMAPLSAPDVTVTSTSTAITLTWEPVNGALSYEVSKGAGAWENVGTDTTWIDTYATQWTCKGITLEASRGTIRDYVQLTKSMQKVPSSVHSYRVRAVGGKETSVEGQTKEWDYTFEYQGGAQMSGVLPMVEEQDQTAPDNGDVRYYSVIVKNEQGNTLCVSPRIKGWKLAALDIGAGLFHTCAHLSDDTARCWGDNLRGGLGIGSTSNVGDAAQNLPTKPVVGFRQEDEPSIAIGKSFDESLCAVQNELVYCWGANTYTMGGIVNLEENILDDSNESVLPINMANRAVYVGQGDDFTCVLNKDKSVTCWGKNNHGQLGRNQSSDYGRQPFEYPLTSNTIASNAVELGVGHSHACVRYSSGDVACWGKNAEGQLGLGNKDDVGSDLRPFTGQTTISDAKRLFVGHSHNCIINTNDRVQCWGSGVTGALGYGNSDSVGDDPNEMPPIELPLTNVVEMALGTSASCALNMTGEVYCWGNNLTGIIANQMQDFFIERPTTKVPLPGPAKKITLVERTACALLTDGQVYCWGGNNSGQLGIGIDENTIDYLGDQEGENPNTPVKLW